MGKKSHRRLPKAERRKRHEAEQEKRKRRLEEWMAEVEVRREREAAIEWKEANPDPPPHPDEGRAVDDLRPDAELRVTSGAICFGLRHNCKFGASRPPADCPEELFKDYSLSAQAANGAWRGYQFVRRTKPGGVVETIPYEGPYKGKPWNIGWFVCHEGVDPVAECRRLLYDGVETEFGGGALDCIEGLRGPALDYGIVATGRYGWGRWDIRGSDLKPGEEYDEPGCKLMEHGFHIIDRKQAQRQNWAEGIGGMSTDGDWEYGLIGFDDNDVAQSFMIYGRDMSFEELYFRDGTIPLGQEDWSN